MHVNQFGEPKGAQWGHDEYEDAYDDPGEARGDHERPRQWKGAHYRDPYWQEQDGPPWQQGREREPRLMKLDFPRFKSGDPIAWVYRALLSNF